MGSKPRVLIVDDQTGVLDMLNLFFSKAGFEVETAVDGQAALDSIAENQPDVVILDVMMPGMSGVTVCRKLRAQPQTAQLPIIMLSAKGEVDDKLPAIPIMDGFSQTQFFLPHFCARYSKI